MKSAALPALLVGLLVAFSLQTASASDLIPAHVAAKLGMTEVWRRSVQVPAGAQSIVNQQIFVHQEKPHQYVEVQTMPDAEGKREVLSRVLVDQLGFDGQPIGEKEAKRIATNDVRRLKARKIDAEVTMRSVPRVNLYTLGDDGTVECRNAETGEPIWMQRVGDRLLPYGEIGVGEDRVSVVNGPNFILLDGENGEIISEVETEGIPMRGSLHVGRYAMVPNVSNGIEGYLLRDPTLEPFFERVNGASLHLPAKSPDSSLVAWGTDTGFLFVMELGGREPTAWFRLDTDGIVNGRPAAADGNRFFFASEGGQVYCVRATRQGEVIWSRPFGVPFYNGPILADQQVLLRSGYGTLYSLGVNDGLMTWDRPVPSIDEILGVIQGKIFVRTLSGSLAVLEQESGDVIHLFGEIQPGKLLINRQTDRLYMVSDSGAVQCLRMEGAELPTFYESKEIAEPETPKATAPGATQQKPSPFDPGSNDPFGAGGNDPFGAGGNDPFGAGGGGNDPFGGGGGGGNMNDPFGGGDDAKMNDPFGGADPFGN